MTGRAIFAAGCFWGVQYFLKRVTGVLSTRVGYTGGEEPEPTYESLHATDSDHAEAVEVVFDPSVVSYRDLVKRFFEIHDPTQVDRQGPDIGRQYRSAIFYLDAEQEAVAREVAGVLAGGGVEVATEIVPAGEFWEAEEYHQDYFDRRGIMPFCHGSRDVFRDIQAP